MLRLLFFLAGIQPGCLEATEKDCDSTIWVAGEATQSDALLQVKHAREIPLIPEPSEAGDLNIVEDAPISDVSSCAWEIDEKCKQSFTYKGIVRTGCITVDHPTPWCSFDTVHDGLWSVCKNTCNNSRTPLNGTDEAFEELLKPKWINRHDNDFSVTTPQPQQGGLFGQDDCSAPLIRFAHINDIKAVKAITQGKDEYFPADESSIAPPGANCGDSARNIFQSCGKYNRWSSMQTISLALGFTGFHVFNPATGTPAHTDVRQGQLGTCYFLSAIASIAYRTPRVIEDMFVRREYWGQGILSTKWLVNGVESIIEVDMTIPAEGNRPYFTSIDPKSGAWWPAILEKAWSKIYGSYKATEGGWWEAAAAAITRAPTVTYRHARVKYDELWEILLTASRNKWPMGAGTRRNNFGLAEGHAYSVLQAWEDQELGRVVTVRNPWHTNYYKGSIPNPTYGDDTGIFHMSFDEYQEAFSGTGVAKVMPLYDVSSTRVYQPTGKITGAFSFSIQNSNWLTVSIVWPNHRMLCKMPHPSYVLAVQKRGEGGVLNPEKHTSSANADYVELPPSTEAATYDVAISADFPENTFIHEVQLNVYAEKPVEFASDVLIDYSTMILSMVGPAVNGVACEVVTIANWGLWTLNKRSLINNIPTYESWDGKSFAYYVDSSKQWFLIVNRYFELVRQGRLWSFAKVSKDEFTCGCSDSPTGVRGFKGETCSYMKARNCDVATQYKSTVESFCPLACNVDICR